MNYFTLLAFSQEAEGENALNTLKYYDNKNHSNLAPLDLNQAERFR